MYSFPFVSPCPSPRHKYVLPKWHQLPHRHLPPVLPLEGHFLSNSWRSGHRLLQLLVRSVLAGQTLPRDPEVTWTLASSSLFSPRRTPDRCNSLILEIVILAGLRAGSYPYRLSPHPQAVGHASGLVSAVPFPGRPRIGSSVPALRSLSACPPEPSRLRLPYLPYTSRPLALHRSSGGAGPSRLVLP